MLRVRGREQDQPTSTCTSLLRIARVRARGARRPRAVQAREGLAGEGIVDGAHRPGARGHVEDAIDAYRIGLISCVTKTTGVPVLWRRSMNRLAIPAGRRGRARAAARRQQQAGIRDQRLGDAQPLLLAAREQADRRVGERAAPTAAIAASMRRPTAARRRPAPHGGRPARAAPGRGPATEVSSNARCCGTYPIPRGDGRRARQCGASPSSMRSSVVLPAPFGPSTARNSPRSSEGQIAKQLAVAEAHDEPSRRTTGGVTASAAALASLLQLPRLERRPAGIGLGNADHGDACRLCEVAHAFGDRRHGLRVVEERP